MRPRPAAPLPMVYGALVAVQVFFGIQYIVAKVVLETVEPQALAVVRVLGAALLLLTLVRLSGRRLPTDAGLWARIAGLSLLGIVINQVMFVEGLSRTTPTHSALINTTIPVCTLAFAVLLGHERLTLRKAMSPAIAIAGVVLIVQPGSDALSVTALGDLLTLANAMSFSLFLVLSRPLLSRVDSLAATAALMSCGAVGITLIGGPEALALDPSVLTPGTWLSILYMIVFPTALAYVFQYWALRWVDSSMVAFFIYLQPVLATALSILLLGERPGLAEAAGGGLIFAAVYLVLSAKRPGL